MKPGPNYKMSAQTKRFLATIVDPQKRSEFKRSAIQAELASLIQPRTARERKTDKGAE
jgi:hypothetical protein